MRPRQSREALAEVADGLSRDNTVLTYALTDAVTGDVEATGHARDTDRASADYGTVWTFSLSRSAAPHGGVLTVATSIPGQRVMVSAEYADGVFRAIDTWPRATWAALEQLRATRDRIAAKGK